MSNVSTWYVCYRQFSRILSSLIVLIDCVKEFEIDFFHWTLNPRLEIDFNSVWDAVKSIGRSIGNIIKPLLVDM